MKQIRPIKEIKLSKSEKDDIYSRILKKAGIENTPVKSPYVFPGFFKPEQLRFVYAAIAVFLVTGGTALASLDSVPGDILYPVKTHIVEKVPDAFAWTSEAKARRNSKKFEERVKEFEVLAEKGRLDEKTAEQIDTEVRKELDAFSRNVQRIENKEEKRRKLDDELLHKIEEHEERLEKIKEENRSDNRVLNDFLDQNKNRLKRLEDRESKAEDRKTDEDRQEKHDERKDDKERDEASKERSGSNRIEKKLEREIERGF
ncbi:MAG TPA: DUF5667 domain-containing protein [Candidatus Paceibacterota bacterium]|nr:DUF5667 domain-containing protein [Candidatus Paceibacterota bacterium]